MRMASVILLFATNKFVRDEQVCTCIFMWTYKDVFVLFSIKALGETCRTSEECNFLNEFSYCKAGKCMCTERYVAYRGKCYLIARELLSPCQLDVQCKESLGEAAKCLEEKCVCSNGRSYEAFSRKCVLNSGRNWNFLLNSYNGFVFLGSRNSWAHSSRWIALIISFAIIYL